MTSMYVGSVGYDELLAALETLDERIVGIVQEAALNEAKHEFPMTQEQVPVRTGALKASGRVDLFEFEPGEVTAGIAYGNTEIDYAVIVHEDLEAFHPHGKAKFVEDVVRGEMESGHARERMAAEMAPKLAKL